MSVQDRAKQFIPFAALKGLPEALAAKEKRNEAIADLKQAYNLNKDFTICNYIIASDYDALGKFNDAYKYYSAYANSNVEDDEYKQYAKNRSTELKNYATTNTTTKK